MSKNKITLIDLIRPYRKGISTGIGLNILYSLFTVISIPLIIPFFQLLFNRTEPSGVSMEMEGAEARLQNFFSTLIQTYGEEKALVWVCMAIIVVFLLKNTFRYLALYVMAPVRTGIIKNLRSELFDRFLRMPLSYYTEERKGDLISRISHDVQEVEWSIIQVIETSVKSPLIILGCLIFMLIISPALTVFVLFLMAFTILVIGFAGRRLKQSSTKLQEAMGLISSQVEEALRGIKVIRAFGATHIIKKQFNDLNEGYEFRSRYLLRRRDLSSPLSEFLGVSTVAVLLWYGSGLVMDGVLGPETFFAFIFAFYQVIEPSKNFSTAYYNLRKGMGALERIGQIIHEGKPEQVGNIFKDDINQDIKVSHVSFSYPEDGPVLHDIHFTIQKSEKIAILGESGTGKTTLIDLIMGLYSPVSGVIYIDDKSVKDLHPESKRKLFGLVTQTPFLFHGSVKENILFGRDDFGMEDVQKAAQIAHCHSFISMLPDGYDTFIGDDGIKLSGGQRQRITIARAILNNPSILIWDEATSSLDAESEDVLQQSMYTWWPEKTVIIIAHRLSTIKNVDKIIVLSDGKIIQMGTHEELIHEEGDYKNYFQKQVFGSET
ncbi:MAG TPA: ABC transporter ATP-binding protein [Saprospiraceae bacterium]|nr:ABC transporter ATP-binding protein [Saprospiraceae bacterium]